MASITTNPDGKDPMTEDSNPETPDSDAESSKGPNGGDSGENLDNDRSAGSGKLPNPDDQPKSKKPPKYPEPKKMSAQQAIAPKPKTDGFFTLYKSGHGYWTRMGTAGGAAIIGIYTASFIWDERSIFLPSNSTGDGIALLVSAAVLGGLALLTWWLMNKPDRAEFLIATDSEMKKVNWTSRKELIGSTRIVIVFMFLIAIFLFLMDILFGYLFYGIGVLREKPL
jgi:preprotein translocase subunit SecE